MSLIIEICFSIEIIQIYVKIMYNNFTLGELWDIPMIIITLKVA